MRIFQPLNAFQEHCRNTDSNAEQSFQQATEGEGRESILRTGKILPNGNQALNATHQLGDGNNTSEACLH
jgi:hypothetical protein